jgi:hypothetical protein
MSEYLGEIVCQTHFKWTDVLQLSFEIPLPTRWMFTKYLLFRLPLAHKIM